MITRTAIFTVLFLLMFGIITGQSVYAADKIAVKAERIFTVSDGIIENGIILIEDGKITNVGRNIRIPSDFEVLDARVVIPGLVDIHTHLGVYSIPNVDENSDGNEMTNPVTPEVRALDSFNFDDPAIPVGLSGGVTTIVSRPGSGNVIGGTSVAVKLKNAPPDEMVIVENCDLKMAIEGNPVGVYGGRNQMPSTLMAVYHLARKAFIEAREYMESWEKYEKDKSDGKEVSPPKRDIGKDHIVMALKREIPVHIHCATASEIVSCIRFAEEFNLRLSLGHAYYANLVIDFLKDKKDVHYNIGPPMMFSYFDDPLTFKNTPAILADAGLSVSLQTDALGGGQKNLLHLAAICVRYGMKEEDALKSITLSGAEAVDLGGRIGSIEEGKDADLVFLNGDPFELVTNVEKVIIDGKIEYENNNANDVSFGTEIPNSEGNLNIPEDMDSAERFAIEAGTIFTANGDPINDGVILVKDGIIERVGRNISIPRNYKKIDAKDFVVIPGLVSPRSYVGIGSNWRRQSSINESSNSIVPQLEVKHAIEPQAPHFSLARELGITTIMVTPGNSNVIGGQGTVLKTEGAVVDDMIIKEKSVMMFGLGVSAKRENRMPSTRMGIAALLRKTLIQAAEYKVKIESETDDSKRKTDLKMESLLPVIKGEMPALIHCERRDDILTALRIADEFGLKIILDGATDAYKVVDEIRERNIPVILENLYRGAGNIEDLGFNPENPAILAEAGITIAFKPSEGSWITPGAGSPGGDLLEIAAMAVKYGLSEDVALKAVTINAARIIGKEDEIGSIEPGKNADFVFLRGHPFKTMSVPEAVIIDGKIVYKRKEGSRLK
ncbi:MAG: amidohydrolase family protein [bacterium]|nr:amidohydrolase family protein [bacterium]